jgi:phytoene/squalene synthetase
MIENVGFLVTFGVIEGQRNKMNSLAYKYVMENTSFGPGLAPAITKAASQQTYYTIRFLVDRERVADAYRAYAYFRWVDDVLDAETTSRGERSVFIRRQTSLLESCYQGKSPRGVRPEEEMLVELVRSDTERVSGLRSYLQNMMAVMAFDAERRGRLISRAELNGYTRYLARAVTEAMHYFIGHRCAATYPETRCLAVTAAHITHMLRDTFDDIQAGYFNIPREVLEAHHIEPQDIHSDAYRAWVKSRVGLAREYFEAGRVYFRHIRNSRHRLAGVAYMARFEWLLETFEREGFLLRPQYNERKSIGTGLKMSWLALSSMINGRGARVSP